MLVEPEGPAAVDADGLERRAAAQERLVVGVQNGLAGVDEPAPADGERQECHVATASGTGLPTAARSGRAFTQDSSISASRLRVPDDAAADPEVDLARRRPRTCGSSARGRGRRSDGSARARPWTRRARPARGRRCGRAPRSSARPVTEPPGKTAPSSSASPTPSRSRPSTVVTMCVTPGELAARPSGRASARSRARTRARGRCARGRRSSRARRRPSRTRAARRGRRAGRVPLIGFVQTRSPAAGEEELGRAGDDRPAVAGERSGWSGRSGARRRASAAGSPAKGACRCWTRLTW